MKHLLSIKVAISNSFSKAMNFFCAKVELEEAKPYQFEKDVVIPNFNEITNSWKSNKNYEC